MPLVSQSIVSYKGGVSQQPDIIRFADQVEEQINGFSSEVEGLQKRPPTVHIKRLGDRVDPLTTKYHVINRDDNEKYILGMSNGALRVWDFEGNGKTVNIVDDASYLNVQDANDDFRAVTVADYTFILNCTKTIGMTTAITPRTGSDTALAYIKSAAYGKTYALYLGGTFMCGVVTPDGGEAKQAIQTTSAYIAKKLLELATGVQAPDWGDYETLVSQTGGRSTMGFARNPNFDFGAYNFLIYGDSVISIQAKGGWDMPNIIVKDGFGNTNGYALKGYVNSVSKLPPHAPPGYIMRIKGESNSDDDDYYVQYDETKNAWLECPAPGITYQLDYSSMPHALVREANGTFSFRRLTWSDRAVGDEDSNPEPSFVGETLNDMFFYRNRLGFISGENVILSASSDFFNFWFKSAATLADTDPIDLAVSSNKVCILTHAVPFSRELMLFSREGQFVLSSDGVLTPKSAKVDQITSFDYSDDAQPLGVGQSIFFVSNRVNYCSLMRYYTVQDVADLKDAEDVSAHVPTYIPKGIFRLSGNTSDNVVTMCSRAKPNTVWVFKYIIQNSQSLQQSWSKWTFRYEGSQVLLAEFVGAEVYFLINTDGGLFLEKTGLTGNALDFSDEPVRYFMDRKIRYTVPDNAPYSDYNDETTVSLKAIYGATPKQGVATYCLVGPDGYYHDVSSWDTEGNFKVKGDIRGQVFFVGRQYEFNVVLSRPMIKQTTADGATVSEDEGRLQVRYYWFNYNNSGPFTVSVDNDLKNKHFQYTCTSKILGESPLKLGAYNVGSGKFKFPVQDQNTEAFISIKSDNPLPLNIISGGWEGYYIRRNSKT